MSDEAIDSRWNWRKSVSRHYQQSFVATAMLLSCRHQQFFCHFKIIRAHRNQVAMLHVQRITSNRFFFHSVAASFLDSRVRPPDILYTDRFERIYIVLYNCKRWFVSQLTQNTYWLRWMYEWMKQLGDSYTITITIMTASSIVIVNNMLLLFEALCGNLFLFFLLLFLAIFRNMNTNSDRMLRLINIQVVRKSCYIRFQIDKKRNVITLLCDNEHCDVTRATHWVCTVWRSTIWKRFSILIGDNRVHFIQF